MLIAGSAKSNVFNFFMASHLTWSSVLTNWVCLSLLEAIFDKVPELQGAELVSCGVTTAGIIPMLGGLNRCSVFIQLGFKMLSKGF